MRLWVRSPSTTKTNKQKIQNSRLLLDKLGDAEGFSKALELHFEKKKITGYDMEREMIVKLVAGRPMKSRKSGDAVS
jgi:hypothetical protein